MNEKLIVKDGWMNEWMNAPKEMNEKDLEKSGKSGMSKQLRIQRIKFVTLVFTHCTLNIVFSVCDYYAHSTIGVLEALCTV